MNRFSRTPSRLALLALSLLVLTAVFADMIASESPIVARYHGQLLFLPAVAHPEKLGPLRGQALEDDIARDGWALWAPIRSGPHTPAAVGPFARASAEHWLGTDAQAHDIVAVTIHGARTLVLTTVAVLVIAVGLGFVFGTLAGQGTPLPDSLLSRAVELTGALPTLVLIALLRAGGLVPSFVAFVGVLGALRTVEIARLVRGEVLRVGGTDYVLAARALGQSTRGIIRHHLFPHVLGPVLVSAAFTAASVVALESALDFVGLGLPRDVPSWGMLLGQVGSGIRLFGLLAPASAIVLTTLCLYVLADGIDDQISARGRAASRV